MTEEQIKDYVAKNCCSLCENRKWCSIQNECFVVNAITEATKELQEENKQIYEKYRSVQDLLAIEMARSMKYEKQIEKMKSDSKTAFIKGIRTMANALKKYDREEGAWTDYFEHTVDKVLKNLLKEFAK